MFIEEVKLRDDTAKRYRRRNKIDTHPYQHVANHVKFIQRKALQRGVHMHIMPRGMQKHKTNTTCYKNEEDKLYWRVQLNFVQSKLTLYEDRLIF